MTRSAILFVFAVLVGCHGPEERPAPAPDAAREAEIPAEVIAERGPRPDVSRLPPGVRQLEDPGEALTMAQDALRRVEAEIAAAPEESPQRERLLKKKALIEASIERLGK